MSNLLKRIGKIFLWTSACLLVLLTLLYLARIPLSIALLESSSKDQVLSIECLDWDLTLTPSLRINEICLTSDNVELTANAINWQYFNRTLDIQRLSITHSKSSLSQGNDSPTFDLDGFKLPANLPIVQVDKLVIDSYLLDKPLTLSIQQDSVNSMLITGDVDANISLHESGSGNALQAEIDWVPEIIITTIPQLNAAITDLAPYLGQQHWKITPINSKFKFAGSTLTSSHRLAVAEKLLFEDCMLDVSFAGTIKTLTTTENLYTQVDLSQLPITFGIVDCEKLAILSQDLATKSLALLIENPIEITPTELKLTNLVVHDPLFPSRISVVIHNAEMLFDDKKQSKGQFLAQFDMPYNSPIANAEFKAAFSGQFNADVEDTLITLNTDKLELNNLTVNGNTSAKTNRIFGNATGKYHSGSFEASGKISTEAIDIFSQVSPQDSKPTAVIKSLASQFQVQESRAQEIKLVLTNKFSNISYQDANITQINNQISATLSDFNKLDITATSEIKKPQMADIALKSISIKHKIVATINHEKNGFTSQGNHDFSTDTGVFGSLHHSVNADAKVLNIELPTQSVLPLQPQLTKINRDTTLKSGQFASSMQYDITTGQGKGSFSIIDLNVDYDEYKIRGANLQERFTLNSAELQLPKAKVLIDSLNVGVPINNITVVIAAIENTFKLLEAKGSIFGGQFMLGEFWLDGRDQELAISAVELSLTELAALQNQSGIEVTGEIGGNLPLLITAGKFKIDKGKLASEHPGTLKIKDNPAFDSIKNKQQELTLLENLNYEKLETNITLTPDGWLKLDFSIVAKNPDKNQAVNFNYGHEENIFTLLKALRITNSVQQGIEKKIEDKYSDKNKLNKGNQ